MTANWAKKHKRCLAVVQQRLKSPLQAPFNRPLSMDCSLELEMLPLSD